MRTYHIILILSLLLISNCLIAQNASQRFLMDKLRIYYVGRPNASTGSWELLDNQQIFSGNENGAFWSNSSMLNAQELVRALLKDTRNGGDQGLQFYTVSIARILNKKLKIWLYDDTASPLNANADNNFGPCKDSNSYVWPCAWSYKSDESESRHWAGYMHMGAKNMNHYGSAWTKATFLHELVHTQDQSENRAHIFYSYTADDWFHYGVDGTHYYTEAVPSIVSAYKEGIANTISFLYDGAEANRYYNWFASNGSLMVETTNNPAATDIPPAAWLYTRIQNAGHGNGAADPNHPGYRKYRIRDLSPEFIVHNEVVQALIFSKYVEYVNLNRFINAVKQANRHLSQTTAPTVAVIFRELCDAGLENGETYESVSNQSHDRPKRYLLPVAYADYFTAYSANAKEDFMAMFEHGETIRPWVNLYWDYYRDNVRNAVPANNYQPEDLTNIAISLDIRQNIGQ